MIISFEITSFRISKPKHQMYNIVSASIQKLFVKTFSFFNVYFCLHVSQSYCNGTTTGKYPTKQKVSSESVHQFNFFMPEQTQETHIIAADSLLKIVAAYSWLKFFSIYITCSNHIEAKWLSSAITANELGITNSYV